MLSRNQADAASLAKGVPVPNRIAVATVHETANRPGSSGSNRDLVPAPRANLGREPVRTSVGVYSRP